MNEVRNVDLGKDFYIFFCSLLDQSRMQSLHVIVLRYSVSVIKIIILHVDTINCCF